ncbi:aldo/keto reductase [Veillonella sp. AS16]|uniref:aldo/keto reductase n=1 Tax=Veillonella sp. AS16 TaxID=936589 RepID=UPI0003E1F2C4|nr:aldo/keto reductase [Veillonella sp. AS16]ETS92839.1 organophosphate reductase domain protein [Veillonella sp. AS16]
MEYITLNTGARMPMMGFGVFQVTDLAQCKQVVLDAIDAGYRLFDTAAVYGNETAVGEAVAEAIAKGAVTREDLFITSKLWVQDMNAEDVDAGINQSLKNLGVEYLDLYLLHQAMGDYFSAWRGLEQA